MNFYIKNDHKKLCKKVSKIKKKWLVSYDNHDFILNLYEDYQRVRYKISQSASNRTGHEVLVFSDKMQFSESLNNLQDVSIVKNQY